MLAPVPAPVPVPPEDQSSPPDQPPPDQPPGDQPPGETAPGAPGSTRPPAGSPSGGVPAPEDTPPKVSSLTERWLLRTPGRSRLMASTMTRTAASPPAST